MSGKVKKVDQVFSRSTSKMSCKGLRITVVLYFGTFDQSLINENCHNCRTSNDTDMKLGPATKLDKRNEVMSKKIANVVMSKNCDVIAIFPIHGNLEQSESRIFLIFCKRCWHQQNSGGLGTKSYIFLN